MRFRTTSLALLIALTCAAPAAAAVNGTYWGTLAGGGEIEVLVAEDDSQVDNFDATGFGITGCESNSIGRSDMALSNGVFSFFQASAPLVSIQGNLAFGTGSGSVRISGVCDTGTVNWEAQVPIDSTIRKGGAGALIGNDKWSEHGAGQASTVSAKRSKTKVWTFGIQAVEDHGEQLYAAKGCAGTKRFSVKYEFEGTGVTFELSHGTFQKQLESGQTAEIKVEIRAKRRARVGSTFSCELLGLHFNNLYPSTDTVVAKLKVK